VEALERVVGKELMRTITEVAAAVARRAWRVISEVEGTVTKA
jgi:hypothetical protein